MAGWAIGFLWLIPWFKIHKPSSVSAQQGDSGEGIQSKYVEEKKEEEWHYCLVVACCRVQNLVNLWNLAGNQVGRRTRLGTCRLICLDEECGQHCFSHTQTHTH